MPLSSGTKAIGPAWASATTKGIDATDGRIDPDDSSLTPPIVLADGYPASFSAVGGNTPRRKVVNELFFRVDSGILDIRNYGILPWDTDVDTLEGGVKQVSGVVYRADVDNGPTYGNAVSPTAGGQTVWEVVSGSLGVPAAPTAPTAVAANGTLDWSWPCPKDNGAAVTAFDFQWREAGQLAFTTVANLSNARHLLTGLANGTVIEAQVQATNSEGDSGYGAQGSGTPVASVPGGGNTLALRADAGDASGEIDLDWLAPDTGGDTITQYRLQWRQSGQSFSTGRQVNLSGALTETTRTSLTDGTEYFFRIRARNSIGNGPWSNETSATPVSPVVPPTDTAPDAPAAITGTPRIALIVDWTWELPDDNGGQVIESYDFQWRYAGNNWSNANLIVGLEVAYYRVTVANTNNGVQARVRASNSIGNSSWRTSGVIAASSLFDSPQQRHRFTSSQTWNWPYDDLERASVVLFGVAEPMRNTSADISFIASNWVGATSDGTTLWFVNAITDPDTAQAYTAATLARNSAFDIAIGSALWSGATSDGTTLWFLNNTIDTAQAYTAATRARNSAFDIALGSGSFTSATSDGTTLWFLNNTTNTAQAYTAATLARNSAFDIAFGSGGWTGACSDGTTLWFVSSTTDTAQAYTAATRARNSAFDIALGSGGWTGGTNSDGTIIWFVDNANNRAEAYNVPSSAILVTDGTMYTTVVTADGFVSQTLTGIGNNQPFVITTGGLGFVEVYPQL